MPITERNYWAELANLLTIDAFFSIQARSVLFLIGIILSQVMAAEESQSEKKTEDSELHTGIHPAPQPEQLKEDSKENTEDDEVYSIHRRKAKALIVLTASVTGFLSPLSSSIYFPALSTIAAQLRVSDTLINLTVTSYMVCVCVEPRELKIRGSVDFFFIDLSGPGARLLCNSCGQCRPTPRVHSMLYLIHRRKYRAGPPKRVCSAIRSPLPSKCRKQ